VRRKKCASAWSRSSNLEQADEQEVEKCAVEREVQDVRGDRWRARAMAVDKKAGWVVVGRGG
jgi:hypothetical protein